MKREFHLQDDKSNKFWTIEVSGCSVVTGNGRIGSQPRETRKAYPTPAQAQAAADKDVLAKLKKGYTEGRLADLPARRKRMPPRLIRINHDDHHASHVGKTRGGDQFFLTHPFAPAMGGDAGGSYVALYLFDAFGALKEAKVFAAKPTRSEDEAFVESLMQSLGGHRFCDIKVAPFAVQAFGRTFGLVFDPGDDEADGEDDEEASTWVTAEPGNYMAFYPPWDGDYDT